MMQQQIINQHKHMNPGSVYVDTKGEDNSTQFSMAEVPDHSEAFTPE